VTGRVFSGVDVVIKENCIRAREVVKLTSGLR
jgi:hypothetical protein